MHKNWEGVFYFQYKVAIGQCGMRCLEAGSQKQKHLRDEIPKKGENSPTFFLGQIFFSIKIKTTHPYVLLVI